MRALLDEGADPDAVDEHGQLVLCTAVAAYDAPVAQALVEGGADPDRPLPDGTTPLLRAVDLGSPASRRSSTGAWTADRAVSSLEAEPVGVRGVGGAREDAHEPAPQIYARGNVRPHGADRVLVLQRHPAQ